MSVRKSQGYKMPSLAFIAGHVVMANGRDSRLAHRRRSQTRFDGGASSYLLASHAYLLEQQSPLTLDLLFSSKRASDLHSPLTGQACVFERGCGRRRESLPVATEVTGESCGKAFADALALHDLSSR